jgi:hypothetical protein
MHHWQFILWIVCNITVVIIAIITLYFVFQKIEQPIIFGPLLTVIVICAGYLWYYDDIIKQSSKIFLVFAQPVMLIVIAFIGLILIKKTYFAP